tara:strand:+ start:1403 stop:2122 length:720 start_codon:yes stop_codon:yes gene_type:complete
MVVYIDDRENPTLIHALLGRLGNVDTEPQGKGKVKRLSTGDYVIGSWGIEAKEINDLYRSILGIGRNRNLTQQLADLCDAYEYPILAVYGGRLKPYFGKRVGNKTVASEMMKMRGVIRNFKLNLYARFPKIRYIEFATMEEYIEWIVCSHTKLAVKNAIAVEKKIRRSGDLSEDYRVMMLASIPGVTIDSAHALLTEFGSLKNIMLTKTNRKALTKVMGISNPTADRIISIREDYLNKV